MSLSDVFSLHQGRAVMWTGAIERGTVRKGDEVESVGLGGGGRAIVTDIDAVGTRVDQATVGMNVGLVMPGARVHAIRRGHVLAAPGSVSAYAHVTAEIKLLPEEEGGRDIVSGHRLLFHVHTAAVWGAVTLPQGLDTVPPNGNATVTVTLDEPLALEEGRRFAFRHHGRAAGSGTVTRLVAQ
ncbi:EF-Tu/IF-2/RF-3 family GTPase [Streptomyces sp. NPDC048637]|uniref:EF-Tu C-terminal domain-related protein n=1 Tax=Streptomyces sp. NPDC048637 TaxID=3155636 RepID=UPI00344A67AA